MIQQVTLKVIPFSPPLIRAHERHLSLDEQRLRGDSMVLMLLDGQIRAQLPKEMVVAYNGGSPIGWSAVALVSRGDDLPLDTLLITLTKPTAGSTSTSKRAGATSGSAPAFCVWQSTCSSDETQRSSKS